MQSHPYFEHQGIALFSHRGSTPPTENTSEAFANALANGAQYIETDVRCTKDGHAVLFHDESLKRLTGSADRVSSLNLEQFQQLEFRDGGTPTTLQAALETFPEAKFNLDIKDPLAVIPTVRVIENLKAHDRVLISSFSEATRKKALSMFTKPVATSTSAPLVLKLRLRCALGLDILKLLEGIGAVQVPPSMYGIRFDTKRFIRQVLATGTQIHFWTINDAASIRRLVSLGACGIVTDDTKLADAILRNS
jgi:glycerophosphoryl diester phosphodiesterase